jgi:hypothetical protein
VIVDHLFVKTGYVIYFIVVMYPKPFWAFVGLDRKILFVLIELAGVIRIYDFILVSVH